MADRLWHAVVTRDSRADGLFVYAVQSTGVYCRPSCPSRKPARARVEFFPSPAMAVASGYRACRRCRPDVQPAVVPALRRVASACRAIASAPDRNWTAARMADAAETSVVQLQRAFRAVLGMAPRDYVAACRRRRFIAEIRSGQSVTEATLSAGFASSSRMYDTVRLVGMSPATYGRGGAGASIEWTTVESPLGRILVAATAKGVCFVEIGDARAGLLAALGREFPHATIARSESTRLGVLADAAHALAAGNDIASALPVDIRGTAFQWKVWRALTQIPHGETRTYTQVAAAIGAPRAVRAVARACATNPVSLVVPCHRVVGADGSLRGYRWGLHVKRALIDIERRRG